jgi:hypothetical protein
MPALVYSLGFLQDFTKHGSSQSYFFFIRLEFLVTNSALRELSSQFTHNCANLHAFTNLIFLVSFTFQLQTRF